PYAGVASIFRSALAAGRPPRVFEDGRQLRDFVHVTDVAHANFLALDRSSPYDGALNIGSGSPRTVADLARALVQASDADLAPIATGEYRAGDVRHVFGCADRARATLGFVASVEFTDGIRDFAHAPLREPTRSASRAG